MKTEQQICNINDALHNMWPSVKPEQVSQNLGLWRSKKCGDEEEEIDSVEAYTIPPACGTMACFGGHCAWWPAFRAQGVQVGTWGQPKLRATSELCPGGGAGVAAELLFGDELMFKTRWSHPADPAPGSEDDETISDHELVANRLRWALTH